MWIFESSKEPSFGCDPYKCAFAIALAVSNDYHPLDGNYKALRCIPNIHGKTCAFCYQQNVINVARFGPSYAKSIADTMPPENECDLYFFGCTL